MPGAIDDYLPGCLQYHLLGGNGRTLLLPSYGLFHDLEQECGVAVVYAVSRLSILECLVSRYVITIRH